jgi:hypothetical protein
MSRKMAMVGLLLVLVAVLTALFTKSRPVILRTTLFAEDEIRACGAYNKTAAATVLFNPFRDRAAETVAEAFVEGWAKGSCAQSLAPNACEFLSRHPLPSSAWRLRNRIDSEGSTTLLYRVSGESAQLTAHSRCAVATVTAVPNGSTWKVTGFGLTYGPAK